MGTKRTTYSSVSSSSLSIDRPTMTSTVEPYRLPDSNPRKRRKLEPRSHGTLPSSSVTWRSESQRRIYSAKLVEALFRARNRSPTSSSSSSLETPASSSGGDVRGIADRVLATAAKGRTRWSRAILASRRAVATGKRRRLRRARVPAPSVGGGRRSGKERSAVEKRVKVLGRLVPGCRGVSVTSLLVEATDYIAALEMQVKAMAAVSQIIAAGEGR